MNLNETLKAMLRSYFIITTGIVISMYVFCLIFTPEAGFKLRDIGDILLLALLTDLPQLIFLSKGELSRKQLLVRKLLHLCVLITIVLYCANAWDWLSIKSASQVLVFVLLVLGVYAAVFSTSVYYDKKLAEQLNIKLNERYHS